MGNIVESIKDVFPVKKVGQSLTRDTSATYTKDTTSVSESQEENQNSTRSKITAEIDFDKKERCSASDSRANKAR